jgi:hypothetical protein
MLNLFIQAINSKQTVEFEYKGLIRTVEPHAVGATSKGNSVLRCFQVHGGHTNAGHDWDLCSLSKIRSPRLTGQTFMGPRNGYKRDDSQMVTIYAQL